MCWEAIFFKCQVCANLRFCPICGTERWLSLVLNSRGEQGDASPTRTQSEGTLDCESGGTPAAELGSVWRTTTTTETGFCCVAVRNPMQTLEKLEGTNAPIFSTAVNYNNPLIGKMRAKHQTMPFLRSTMLLISLTQMPPQVYIRVGVFLIQKICNESRTFPTLSLSKERYLL